MTPLLRWVALVALFAAGCGGRSDSPSPPAPGVFRLSQGLHGTYAGIEVGVMQVLVKASPQKALVSLVDAAKPGSQAQQVELAVGESTLVGPNRFVLVATGKGDKKAYVDFRLEPAAAPSGGATPNSTPAASTPPQG